MATWQCDFQFVPENWLTKNYRKPPAILSDDLLSEEPWWERASLSSDYAQQLNHFLPRTKSWSTDLELYGAEDGHCLGVLRKNGQITSVYLRVDLRQVNESFIKKVVSFAQQQHCYLADIAGRLIGPEQNHFQALLKESRAYRFVVDPEKYLEELTIRPVRFP